MTWDEWIEVRVQSIAVEFVVWQFTQFFRIYENVINDASGIQIQICWHSSFDESIIIVINTHEACAPRLASVPRSLSRSTGRQTNA